MYSLADGSLVARVVNDLIVKMQEPLGLDRWTLKVEIGEFEDVGACTAQPEYRHATLHFNPERLETGDEPDEIVAHELADRSRVVAETPHFLAATAFAGRFAYEVWVLPKRHASRYEAIAGDAAGELAVLMRRVVRAMDAVLSEPAYNWYLHTAPLRAGDLSHYHWHWEILPRTSRPAGLEWGGGCFVSAVPPERAAAELRAAIDTM